jgi:amino acid transporter
VNAPAAGPGALPRPTLSLAESLAMVVGHVVGVGIFKAPAIVAGNAAGETMFFALWIAGGVASLVGALCYAELGSAYPNAGGEYFFLRRAYGNSTALLFAWARMSVIQTGVIAAIAYVFADYASQLFPLGSRGAAIYAAVAVIGVTALNVAGTHQGKRVQFFLTFALALAIAAVAAAGLAYGDAPRAPVASAAGTTSAGLAMIFVLLTYGGWNEVAYLTAEMHDLRRNIVRALVLGILVVTALYLLLNLAYINTLGLAGMRASKAVAADLMRAALGDYGATILSLVVMLSALSALNASVFTGARTNYALGRDFGMFGFLGKWDARGMSPVNGLLLQGAVSLLLVLLASSTPDGFETLIAYTAPAFWLFFLLTTMALFVLRREQSADATRFRVPLYPLTPLLFGAVCAYMLYSSVGYAMSLNPASIGAVVGMGVLCAGLPVMLFARRSAR